MVTIINLYNILTIILAILALGFMVFIHELGHFLVAKKSGVKVNEFTIGFGPALWKKQIGETLYAVRIIPFGGAVMMDGEDEESDDEGSFQKAPVLNRMLIVVAGAFMNILMGFIIVFFWVLPQKTYTLPQIAGFAPEFAQSQENIFQTGDIISSVDGYKVLVYSDISMSLAINEGDTHTFEIIRDGKKQKFENVPFTTREITLDGEKYMGYGLIFGQKQATFFDKIKLSFYRGVNFVRIVFVSIGMLFDGSAGVKDLSGPIAITSTISNVATQSASDAWYLIALISVNLGVMNLLPLPALDGGRLVFLIIELFRGKPINPKYEGYVHAVGLVLFMALFVFVAFNDIFKIFGGS